MPLTFNVFTYGTLQIPEVMETVAGRGFPSEPARLPDHARYRLRGLVYPGLCREPGVSTEGVLYRQVDAEALGRLDAFEDDFYLRESLAVLTGSGLWVAAEVYVVPPRYHSLLARQAWDLKQFRDLHLPEFLRARCRRP